jgi:hypothetical protein
MSSLNENPKMTIMKSRNYLIATVGSASLAFCISVLAQTMPRSAGLSASASPIVSASPNPTSNRPLPFHGMVSAVDQKNKTFTISGKEATRVFKVTTKTQILKGAATATMKDIVDNEEVSGSYWRNTDGSLEAKVVKLGPMEKKTVSAAPNATPSTTPNVSTTPKS